MIFENEHTHQKKKVGYWEFHVLGDKNVVKQPGNLGDRYSVARRVSQNSDVNHEPVSEFWLALIMTINATDGSGQSHSWKCMEIKGQALEIHERTSSFFFIFCLRSVYYSIEGRFLIMDLCNIDLPLFEYFALTKWYISIYLLTFPCAVKTV